LEEQIPFDPEFDNETAIDNALITSPAPF